MDDIAFEDTPCQSCGDTYSDSQVKDGVCFGCRYVMYLDNSKLETI